jgi:hypothetical protein
MIINLFLWGGCVVVFVHTIYMDVKKYDVLTEFIGILLFNSLKMITRRLFPLYRNN